MPPSRGSEPLDIGSMSRSRSTSFSSDSQFPRNTTLAPPPDTTPPPAFIAAPAASQIITADQEFNTVDFVGDEEQEDGSGALVSPDALVLLNNFLDHLLFNILAVSKSTQLSSIRPAVADVLKPRLAKEVVSAADDELSDYMGGEGDEQFDFRGGQKPAGDFDLIRSWKRTRLRCMVYTRLGDMEEDEEDEYIARDGLVDTSDSPRRFASHVDIVTPAAAIFLTSIIEHLGEQALIIAGETSRSRLSTKLNLEHDEVTESGAERGRINRLVVEGHDMEKLAMNSTLGRLWRTWRKRTRAPKLSRTLSRESFRHRGIASTLASSRKSSVATIDELPARSVTSFDTAEAHEEEVDPAAVPLPISQHDVQEISIPGFSAELVGEIRTMEAVVAHKVRPRSLMVLPSPLTPRSPSSVESSPVVPSDPQRSKLNRHARSQSLPNNYSPPDYEEDLKTPVAESSADQRPASAQQISSPTPSEERRQLETMYEQEEPSDPAQTANTGLAISTPVATEATKESEADSPSRKRRSAAARNSMFAPSLSGASVVVEVSRPGSAQTAYPAEEAQRNAETIEGHGTVEKPRPASAIQRPRRKASGDPARKAERDRSSPSVSATNTTSTSERVVEERSRAQGARDSPTHVQKGPADKLSKDSNARKSVNQSWFLNNDDEDDATAATAPAAATATAATATAVAAAAAAPTVGQPSAEPSSLTSATGGLPSLTTNRAAVHRVPGQPPTPSKSRRSDSLSDKRPVTSGSSTSQVSSKLKDMVGRSPQGEAAPPHGRNSSEASGQSSGQHSPGLEQLIKSDETIHYTLTPKNMRDMEQPDSSRWKANRSSTADLATFLKTTAPPGDEVPRTTAPKASPKPSSPKPSSKPSSPKTNVPKYQSISDTKFPSVPRSKMATSLARDAKPANDSTRDFADFIKSTGPAGPPGPTTPTTPASAVDAPKSRTSSSSRGRRLSDSTDFSKKFIRPGSGLSGSTRGTSGPRLQARAAVAPKGEQTSDLIDFIREGPPTPGSHRISRSVAPFRNTMDSDDMNNSTVRESRTSTPDEPAAGKSLTSFGASAGASSTGGNAEKKPTPAPAPVPAPAPKTDDFDAPMPARKQRRVPDPYAIDDDDDEELEELLGLQEKPKREEESLIDFLRNATPPPQDPTPPSSIITNTKATTKSSSSTGMRARFLRSASEKMPASKPSKSSLRSTQTDPRSNGGQSNYIVKPTGGSKPPQVQVTHGPPAMPKRETETSALADFLKNSEPPEPPRAPSAFAMNRGKDTNGLSRFLMRKKKVDV